MSQETELQENNRLNGLKIPQINDQIKRKKIGFQFYRPRLHPVADGGEACFGY